MRILLCMIMLMTTTTSSAIDFALSSQVDEWLHHPVLGDPSFDSFVHANNNPVHRGVPGAEWPVNGFLFISPLPSGEGITAALPSGEGTDSPLPKGEDSTLPSGEGVEGRIWYLYIGVYARGYAMGADKVMNCIVYRSVNQGVSWEYLGPVFPSEPFYFEGSTSEVKNAPDVSVVYDAGRYHMIYDFATANSSWEQILNPNGDADNGIGYAWADRPEGPFYRTSPPVYSIRKHTMHPGKYRRGYAATLVKRQQDWMVLAMMDSGPAFGWALIGLVADKPEGPYSEPIFLRQVESTYYHPPLLEFFPAFVHEGYAYAPATSVAANRNYQALFRAPLESAHLSEAWSLFRDGSIWHAAPLEHEYAGIWGQTFSGAVDPSGAFRVMFPSLDPQNFGTINIANREWAQPFRDQGFIMSGHKGPSLGLLRQAYSNFTLHTTLKYCGNLSLLLNYKGPLGPDKPTSDASLHPLTLTDYTALELSDGTQRIVTVNPQGERTVHHQSNLTTGNTVEISVTYSSKWVPAVAGMTGGGTREAALEVTLNQNHLGRFVLPISPGLMGLLVGKESHVEVSRFEVQGETAETRTTYLCTEGILGAAAAQQWKILSSPSSGEEAMPTFRYGVGALSTTPDAVAKWNVHGTSFALWAPTGSDYGKAEILVDGEPRGKVSYQSCDGKSSGPSPVFMVTALAPGPHAIVLRVTDGKVPLDCLEVTK